MGIKWWCCFFLFLRLWLDECLCVNLEGPSSLHDYQDHFKDQASYRHGEYEIFARMNRKAGCGFRRSTSGSNPYSVNDPGVIEQSGDNKDHLRRKLVQEMYNLPALLGNSDLPEILPQPDILILSMASGAFPASENSKGRTYLSSSSGVPLDLAEPFNQQSPQPSNSKTPTNSHENSKDEIDGRSENSGKLFDILLITAAAVLLASILLGTVLVCRRQGQANTGPWRTGISDQFQKSFVTDVPKFNKSELEVACDEFTNILNPDPEYTIFKGTLPNGTDIAVVSTLITSLNDWSNSSESCFRRKIDMLSRVNHKNFVSLLGFCEEEEPFMRMMVLEYAPNGTLNDNLHIKEFGHLSWEARMRIIMGMSYCLQHMHHDLNPPVALPYLQSNNVFLTDDYAAKLTDMSVWKEVIKKRNMRIDGKLDREAVSADCAMNIYNFGIVLLEVISGKLPQQEDGGASVLNWAMQYLDDGGNIKRLLDPTLKDFREAQLETICEVIKRCLHPNSKNRPTMREITQSLRSEINISPDAANPTLSPLLWAELEILSAKFS